MIVYLSDPKNSTREHLNLINNFVKVAGNKTSAKKSVAFLYTKDKYGSSQGCRGGSICRNPSM